MQERGQILLGGKRVGNETVGGSCVRKDCGTN